MISAMCERILSGKNHRSTSLLRKKIFILLAQYPNELTTEYDVASYTPPPIFQIGIPSEMLQLAVMLLPQTGSICDPKQCSVVVRTIITPQFQSGIFCQGFLL